MFIRNKCVFQVCREVATRVDKAALANKSVAITGAGGFIGRMLVACLLHLNAHYGLNCVIHALARNEMRFFTLFSRDAPNLVFTGYDLHRPVSKMENIDIVFHCANVVASRYFVDEPVDTIMSTITGTKNILDFADSHGAKSFVYLSSIEVYGSPAREDVDETEPGAVNPLSVRSSYSEAKRLAECLCVAYAQRSRAVITIARLTQTFGPGIEPQDARVFAQFARQALRSENIVMHTRGETRKSYCSIEDAVSGLLTLATRGENANAYNIANERNYVSIHELAELFCLCSKGSSIVFEMGSDAERFYPPVCKLNLKTDKLRKLGWNPVTPISEMVSTLVAYIAEYDSMNNRI